MPSKEVITFWLDMGAPIWLLPRVRAAAALEKGRTPGQAVVSAALYRAYTGPARCYGSHHRQGGLSHVPGVVPVDHVHDACARAVPSPDRAGRWTAPLVSSVATALLVASLASAAIPDGRRHVPRLLRQGRGALRVIDPAREQCRSNEVLVSWNAVGPAGQRGPQGDRGTGGTSRPDRGCRGCRGRRAGGDLPDRKDPEGPPAPASRPSTSSPVCRVGSASRRRASPRSTSTARRLRCR